MHSSRLHRQALLASQLAEKVASIADAPGLRLPAPLAGWTGATDPMRRSSLSDYKKNTDASTGSVNWGHGHTASRAFADAGIFRSG